MRPVSRSALPPSFSRRLHICRDPFRIKNSENPTHDPGPLSSARRQSLSTMTRGCHSLPFHAMVIRMNSKSRKVAVTLPDFSFRFSKNVLAQSCSLSHGEMVPDIFVCWPGGGGPPPPPLQLHPSAPRGQRFENTVNTSVFSSSSPQQ